MNPEFEEAVRHFLATAPEYGAGLSNHGPMACDALLELGHPARIPSFVQRYGPRLRPFTPGTPLTASERGTALGDPDRIGDWTATYERELAERPWREVLREALPTLLPGLFGAAGHGAIRTAHAARALERCETEVRVRELARALGYWAGRYRPLPGLPGAKAQPGRSPAAVLRRLPTLPSERRRGGLLVDRAAPLAAMPEFASEIESLDLEAADPEQALSELCVEMAGLYLRQPSERIAYLHAFTTPAAVRLLAPYLGPEERRVALGYAVQAAAAFHAFSAEQEPPETAERDQPATMEEAEIRYRAAQVLDEHAAKMAEACLREHAIRPEPCLLAAATDAARAPWTRGGA